MDHLFQIESNRIICTYDSEQLWVEPWGVNGLRVRTTHLAVMPEENWALLPQVTSDELSQKCKAALSDDGRGATIVNGKIRAEIEGNGRITFYNHKNQVLLREYVRNRNDLIQFCSALNIEAREFKGIPGGNYQGTLRFESDPAEKIFGMGQYQQPFLDVKNCTLELAHRNSQASVPFALSSLGYGFLWNNPAIGRVTFGKNITEWVAHSTKLLDYWITAGDSPAEIEEAYAGVTGTAPLMPDYATGFWQCKLRYQTQEELLEVAREYKHRGLPISVIVVDFFHWTKHGEWKFDPDYWPDPEGMVRGLKEMGIELMVSIWPTVDQTSENYPEMVQKGYLVRTERGIRLNMDFIGNTVFYDATHPGAREFVWGKAKQHYYDKGIRIFWLDEAEPEFGDYDFDHYRYHLGSTLEVGNIYPLMYAKTFFDGMEQAGQKKIINLIRCAWAGSQRYGALVWSGDIHSSFASMQNQLKAGLNMGLAGIPWWTTDIGGFHGGVPEDPSFRECLIRWFQYGAFCPVFRLHGDREPRSAPPGTSGGSSFGSGSPNEVWSYGDESYQIFVKYMMIREQLRPYVMRLMGEAHEKGTPPMRPLFYDFPEDKLAWGIEDEYMFGPDILVAPVIYEGARTREVYLPLGTKWRDVHSGQVFEGGQRIACDAPLDVMPVFVRDGAEVEIRI